MRDTTGDQLWASPAMRTGLWAGLSLVVWFAVARLGAADFGFTRTLLFVAILLPPILFAKIVPPRGHPFLRGLLIGFGASAVLALLGMAFGLLGHVTPRGEALRALIG